MYDAIDEFTSVEERAFHALYDLRLDNCNGAAVRTGSDTIDIVCSKGVYVVEYLSESSQLALRDYIVNSGSWRFDKRQPDRYGGLSPSYWLGHFDPVEPSPDGRHIYVATATHGIVIYERVGNEPTEPNTMLSSMYRRLDLMHASANQIQFNDQSVEGDCLASSTWTVDGVSYSVESSKWQLRDVSAEWMDIAGTEQTGKLCSYRPTKTNEYRLVAEMTIAGETGKYASNFFGHIVYTRLDALVVEPGKVTLDTLTFSSCEYISNRTLNGVAYTVRNSQWQARDDANAPWEDVADTQVAGQLCPYNPTDEREYRLIGTYIIDGTREYHSSNVMKKEADST